MIFDTNKMHRDILKRLNEIDKPRYYLGDKLGISVTVFQRMNNQKHITMHSFLVLLEWLDKDATEYIYPKVKRIRRK